jgi:hypothetical protein
MTTLKDIIQQAGVSDAAETDRVAKVDIAATKKTEYDAAHADGVAATQAAADAETKLASMVAEYQPATNDVP